MRVGVGVTQSAQGGGQGRRGGAAGQTLRSPGARRESYPAVVVKHRDSDHPVRGPLGRHVGGFHFRR